MLGSTDPNTSRPWDVATTFCPDQRINPRNGTVQINPHFRDSTLSLLRREEIFLSYVFLYLTNLPPSAGVTLHYFNQEGSYVVQWFPRPEEGSRSPARSRPRRLRGPTPPRARPSGTPQPSTANPFGRELWFKK